MIKLIVGKKGSGKTKILVERINEAAKNSKGNVICIEKDLQLTYNIDHSVRLINIVDYKVEGFDAFYGFITGVLAGNYDIEQVYVDGLLKIGEKNVQALGELLEKIDAIASDKLVVVTVSAAEEELTENVKKYL
jgi:chromosomal replication initiation ATPase DnaA